MGHNFSKVRLLFDSVLQRSLQPQVNDKIFKRLASSC
jgi:hypothetical protein